MRLLRALLVAFCIGLTFGSLAAHADLGTTFPEPADIAEGFATFQKLDLASDQIALTNSRGGTSSYAVVNTGGKPIGAFIPPNAATQIDGEASAYSLARVLGVAESVQAGKITSVAGAALARVRALLLADKRPGQPAENVARIIAWLDAHVGKALPGVLKFWNHKPYDFDEVVDPTTHSLNRNSAFAQWIRADGPMPTEASVKRTVGKVAAVNTEHALARELSTHLLIDALLSQWDRFSGGNLQVLADGTTLHFALYDNGGTWGAAGLAQKTMSFVSRFDRDAAKRLHEMDAFLHGKGDFYGAKDEAELRAFLQLDGSDSHWKTFKQNLSVVVKAIDAVPETSGKYF